MGRERGRASGKTEGHRGQKERITTWMGSREGGKNHISQHGEKKDEGKWESKTKWHQKECYAGILCKMA